MATTSIGSDRPDTRAIEFYPDAVFIRDDHKLYFGNGGDASIWYDSTSDTNWVSGRSIRASDNFQVQFGDQSDAILKYNAASDCFHLTGKTIKISMTSDLVLVGLPTSATNVVTGGLFTSDATGTQVRIV